MGFGTLYVHADGDVDETKSEIEDLKKKTKALVSGWLSVRKLDVPKASPPDQANIMVEFQYNKNTNLQELEKKVSGINGVHIVKSIASL